MLAKGIVPATTIMIIMSTTSAASATAAAMSGRAHDELTLGQHFRRLNPLLVISLASNLGNGAWEGSLRKLDLASKIFYFKKLSYTK